MKENLILTALLLLLAIPAFGQEAEADDGTTDAATEVEETTEEPRGDGIDSPMAMSGMSILGNEEAPKSLVIVPWKSSRLGDGLGISNALDQSPRAVDKEVFLRELHFHGLRSGSGE